MGFEQGELYHIYNRGNNGQTIFFERENYLFFLKKVKKELTPLCDVLAYCLMPNHYHLLVRIDEKEEADSLKFSRKLGTLQSSYTRAINKAQNRYGSLFQQRVKHKNLVEYAHICFHYIHQNPVAAGLCSRLEDWEYSSFRDYIGLRDGMLPNREMAFRLVEIPRGQTQFYKESSEGFNENVISEIF